ncbi:MAG: hypothetical protein M3007_00540 [Candidatus Eremiobacteraeota bacterium]|nr:hypothetical protein [Candidatus Eremiobacteraeota bacterium]
MAQEFSIETLDRSGRWYFTPGAKSIYDLRIRNDSNISLDCSLVLEDPPSGVSLEPQSFALRGHEVRTVTVTFAADAPAARSQRVLLTLRDRDGAVHATFEHPLITTGGTDCSISLAWKDAVIESGEVRAFDLTCCVRSQSDGPTSFSLAFTPHPALTFPTLQPVSLDPGESKELPIRVLWDPKIKDDSGFNHPLLLEVGVPVSNGRRTSRMRWDAVEAQMQPFAWNKVLAVAQTAPAARNGDGKPAESPPPVTAPEVASVKTAPEPTSVKTAAELSPASAQVGSGALPAVTSNGHTPTKRLEDVEQLAVTQPTPIQSPAAVSVVAKDKPHAQAASVTATRSEIMAPPPSAITPPASAITPPPSATIPQAGAIKPLPIVDNGFTAPPRRESAIAHHDKVATGSLRSRPVKKLAATWLIGSFAAAALVVAAVLFRPSSPPAPPSPGPVVLSTPVVTTNSMQSVAPSATLNVARHKPVVQKKAAVLAPKHAASPSPSAIAQNVATPAPAHTAATLIAARVAHRVATVAAPPVRQQSATRRILRQRLAALAPGPVVALGGVEAHYGARGRAVRVNWAAAEQSAANIQLIDNHGTILNAITVRGTRESVLLYLPPRYRGSVTIQLTSTGRLGERVAQTAFLPAFGY